MLGCSLNLITFRAPHLEVLELMALPKTAPLTANYHPLSHSFLSTPMSNGSLPSSKTKSFGNGIEETYFRRNRMDRQFWRFDDSPVDLKFCGIRIMSVKCLNCLIWLKEFSQIRGKFQKCYIPNISDSNIRQSLSSSNIWIAFWNAFAK